MDIPTLSRFAPEAAVLSIAGYFALRCLLIFRDIVDKMNDEQKQSLEKLSKSIDNMAQESAESRKESIENRKVAKELHDFMRNLNGRLKKATRDTLKENA